MRTPVARTAVLVVTLGAVLALALTLVVGTVTGPPGEAVLEPVGTAPETRSATPKAGSPRKRAPAAKRPNIVVVMADDMRVDDLAFAPRLRRLVAAHGVTFENSFSPFPLCCPARASFLTGQYAHNHGVYWHEPPYGYGGFDDSRTLATSLQDAGYRTGYVGKYLNRYGIDPSRVTGAPSHTYVPAGWSDWRATVENPGDAGFHGSTYDYFDTAFNLNGVIDDSFTGVYQSKVIGDLTVDMAEGFAADEDPFFMYVNYVAPHHGAPFESDDPGGALDEDGRWIGLDTPARPDWVKGRYDAVVDRAAGESVHGAGVEPDVTDKPAAVQRRLRRLGPAALAALREVTRQRAESIHVMDLHIARLVRALKRSGEWGDTVFVFTSDNGMLLGEHGFAMTKVWPYEPSLRVPMLVTGPGLREAQQRYDPISTVDLSATVLDLAEAAPPLVGDGVSRLPTLLGGDAGWRTPVVTEAIQTSGGRAPGFTDARTTIGIRVGRYSYTRYRGGSGELYDLVTDPRQDEDVYRSADYRAVRRALDDLWWRIKDCRGAGCAVDLPAVLAADAATNRQQTDAYWAGMRHDYGWEVE